MTPIGRELDALVAEKVMGHLRISDYVWFHGELHWPVDKTPPSKGGCIGIKPLDQQELPHYSTDIAAAWAVVEKLCEFSWHIELHGGHHLVTIFSDATTWETEAGDSTPEAICLAALAAVGATA